MKILVTGSSGLTGAEAVKFFRGLGHTVVGVDSNMRAYFFNTPKKEVELNVDIRNEIQVNSLFQKYKFDAVIHTAAQPSHDWSKKEPLTDFDINARGTLILLEAVRKYNPKCIFVHCSTDKVYGENMVRKLVELPTRWHSPVTFSEKLPIDYAKRSLFGCSKASADLYVQEYGLYFGIRTACFRCGCITGANHEGAEEHGFLAYLAKCVKEGIPYKIFGYKGKQVRDIIHAYDLVAAFAYFIAKPRCGAVYNMGGGPKRSVSILEAISMMENETGNKLKYKVLKNPREGDRQWDVHDVSKFKKDYPNWKYQYSLKEIIHELCQK